MVAILQILIQSEWFTIFFRSTLPFLQKKI